MEDIKDIKFRGKSIDNGKWFYGYLYINSYDNRCFILEDGDITEDFTAQEVDQSTIGQYTGLKDKNGVEIYEGDIIETHFIVEGTEIRAVVFERGTFAIDDSEDYKPLLNEFNHCGKVIGNIYDNPELLKQVGDYADNDTMLPATE